MREVPKGVARHNSTSLRFENTIDMKEIHSPFLSYSHGFIAGTFPLQMGWGKVRAF